jgi:hypothetical protein
VKEARGGEGDWGSIDVLFELLTEVLTEMLVTKREPPVEAGVTTSYSTPYAEPISRHREGRGSYVQSLLTCCNAVSQSECASPSPSPRRSSSPVRPGFC